MRLLVCGDRDWDKPAIIKIFLEGFYATYRHDLIIIEGCARGADREACDWRDGHLTIHFPALWDEHDREGKTYLPCSCPDDDASSKRRCKVAGPRRNRQMLYDGKPDLVLAFHDDIENSKGTKDMRNIAVASGIPTYVIAKQYPF